MAKKVYHIISLFFLLATGVAAQNSGTEADNPALDMNADANISTVSKYIWRGQRLTNDWSLQPSAMFSAGSFSVNVWGTLDLTAVNEGDTLFIKENPESVPGNENGLQGKFSEIDYTFSYSVLTRDLNLDFGSIIYTFPERSGSLPATVELYGSIGFETLPLSPSATLYVDVDETRETEDTGLYFQMAGGHALVFGHPRFPAIDFSGWVGFANSGFGQYYYGTDDAGPHDVNFTLTLPINLSEQAGASLFVAYSALVGDFRDKQYPDARDVYRRTGPQSHHPDTLWGGVNFSFDF